MQARLTCLFVVVALLVVVGYPPTYAQEPAKPLTITVTLTAEQVETLTAYRSVMRVPTPTVLSQPPAQTLQEWVTAQVQAHIDRLVSEAERTSGERLLSEVRALTPAKRKALEAALETIKK